MNGPDRPADTIDRRQFLKTLAGAFGFAGIGFLFTGGRRRHGSDKNIRPSDNHNVSDHTALFFGRGDDLAG